MSFSGDACFWFIIQEYSNKKNGAAFSVTFEAQLLSEGKSYTGLLCVAFILV